MPRCAGLCLLLTLGVACAEDHRLYLLNQSSWGEKLGFYLDFENKAGPDGVARRDTLRLILGVADGRGWRFLTAQPTWQLGRTYLVRAVIDAEAGELWLDGQSMGRTAGGFAPAPGELVAGEVPAWANAPTDYWLLQRTARVSAGERRLEHRFSDPAEIHPAVLLFAPPALHRSPWETRAAEALTIEAEVRLTARPEPRSLAPLIDAYGQHRYADYPDRLASDDDLRRSAAEEQQRYRTWGEPSGFDRYGGTTGLGWRESATGFYRLYQRQGYWWLLSPDGNPCFYVGMCTAPSLTWETTPVTGREYLFAWLPPREGPLAAARSHNQWGIQDGTQYVAFHTANLVRKYGEGWTERAQQSTAQRLRVWGFSGLGKWSGQEGLPVAPVLQRWGAPNLVRHPDVFDPAVRARWEQSLRGQIEPRQNDPLVLGWSLGNEFDEIITTAEIRDILRLPRDTPARRALLAEAAATCHGGDPAALARAWKLDPERPDYATAEPPAADLEAMRRYYADRYYAFIYQTVKAIDPNHLYFGFWIVPGWWENEHDWRLIAPHCDAIGYDRYSFEFMDERLRRLADETAKPILCGEFSFPSFYEGRRGFGRYGTWAETDAESGERYAAWLRDAARHPRCVGVMWFEYRDQPLTGRGPGRGDHLVIGEHFAFGAVDVGDRPKWELVTRMREANLAVATWRQEAMAGAAPSGR